MPDGVRVGEVADAGAGEARDESCLIATVALQR
jgi:hypothetical protein